MLTLRPLRDDERALALHWRNHASIRKWCRQYEPISEAHHRAYWERVEHDPHTKMYAIDDYGKAVGVCGLTSIDWINRRAEFSLYIAPEHQGNGFSKPALQALLAHGFNVLNLNLIWGEVFEGNPALEIFQAAGFKFEGWRRDFYYRDGKYIMAAMISILKTEFDQCLNSQSSSSQPPSEQVPPVGSTTG